MKLTVAQLCYGENSVPNLTQMVNKFGKYEYKFVYSLMLTMTITETTFTKLVVTQCVSVKKSCAEFHENPSDNLVTGARSQMKGHGLHIRCTFILCKCVGFILLQDLVWEFIGKHQNYMKMDLREAFIKLGCGWNW
jgi:hypothetical protein